MGKGGSVGKEVRVKSGGRGRLRVRKGEWLRVGKGGKLRMGKRGRVKEWKNGEG